jgi:mRNA interferase MazF
MEEGQVVKAEIPQSDGKRKERPVLLLKPFPPYGDWLVAGISSKLERASDIDLLIPEDHPDFAASGLRQAGLIRTGFLGMVPEERIPGAIGAVSVETHQRVLDNLVEHLKAGSNS